MQIPPTGHIQEATKPKPASTTREKREPPSCLRLSLSLNTSVPCIHWALNTFSVPDESHLLEVTTQHTTKEEFLMVFNAFWFPLTHIQKVKLKSLLIQLDYENQGNLVCVWGAGRVVVMETGYLVLLQTCILLFSNLRFFMYLICCH